jgi:3'(2'), 5'-bisphosphate nucleotidase
LSFKNDILIQELTELIKSAGEEVLKIYNSNNFETKEKKDNSPITKADLLSNKILLEGLPKIKDYPILSEEATVDYKIRKTWEKFWMIDPIDGTKDFIAKNDEFTINIALIENNKPILGLIYAPALNELYWGIKNLGAFKNGIRIFNNSTRKEIIGTCSRFHSNDETTNFFINNNISKIKGFGSALKFCKLAEGVVDIYPRYTGSMEWDIAAGEIILKESGCDLLNLKTNQHFKYNKEDFLNDFFVASRIDLLQRIKIK